MNTVITQIAPNAYQPKTVTDIPDAGYMVYILAFNGQSIVCGHGRKNRAKVIFDSPEHATTSHIKSLIVRIYQKHGGSGPFERYLIPCPDRQTALALEHKLHGLIGGNSLEIPEAIKTRLFQNLSAKAKMVLEIALCSAFSGLRDLKTWRTRSILDTATWDSVEAKLGTF